MPASKNSSAPLPRPPPRPQPDRLDRLDQKSGWCGDEEKGAERGDSAGENESAVKFTSRLHDIAGNNRSHDAGDAADKMDKAAGAAGDSGSA